MVFSCRYTFKGVLPGNYYIANIDSTMCVEKKQTVISVSAGGSNVAQPLRIEGYSIKVRILTLSVLIRS